MYQQLFYLSGWKRFGKYEPHLMQLQKHNFFCSTIEQKTNARSVLYIQTFFKVQTIKLAIIMMEALSHLSRISCKELGNKHNFKTVELVHEHNFKTVELVHATVLIELVQASVS
eukprot:TRINITY_DN501_c1_g1_i1.p1 TRINITY_DN501_c1_g1~~TRINITY_DN501_c1_g1_i1.p1  ORF type:complete len:114 (+),score=14.54 TRINITY_DN501_c1_g1_i1:309-650(+)